MSEIKSDRDLLIRIDERLKTVAEKQVEIKDDIDNIKKEMKESYVTKAEFTPVQRGAYGALGLFVTTTVGIFVHFFQTLGIK
jgi:hypothetical protein